MIIAVLLTTYNRREKTVACLKSLRAQTLPANVRLQVFLTDDASKDGTPEAVRSIYPDAYIFHGNGSLYWAGGMRNTWREAMKHNPDGYLLLNDDTVLKPQAVAVLINQCMDGQKPVICLGSTCDAQSGEISYGGWKLRRKGYWKSTRTYSDKLYLDCDFGNANIMLVPRSVVEKIGILSDHFTHSLADYDYTLNAKKAGIAVRVAPGFLGHCTDDHGNNWKGTNTTLRERLQYLKSPKGLAYSEYLRFIKDHFPLSYPSAFVKLWMKTFFPVVWDTFKK